MGVGGMIGGGIFSVMGLAAGITGRATPLAFALGGALALSLPLTAVATTYLLSNLAGRPAIVDQYAPELADVHHVPEAQATALAAPQ